MRNNRYIIADKQDITHIGIRYVISNNIEDATIVDVRSRLELINALKEEPNSVVVLDFTMFDIGSQDELLNLAGKFGDAIWIMFSSDLSEQLIRRLGVEQNFSMVLKDNRIEEIQSALRYANRGERFLCHQITNLLLTPTRTAELEEKLTPTEIEILKLIAAGKSVKEIANERNSSIHTITTHKKNIFRKLGVNTIYEATKWALKAGIVDLVEYYI